jgi:predicted amidohydrolase YtcJ
MRRITPVRSGVRVPRSPLDRFALSRREPHRPARSPVSSRLIALPTALAAWARGGAFASFEEKTRGSVEPGKQADFLILSADPNKVDPQTICEIVVETTVISGRVVSGADPF